MSGTVYVVHCIDTEGPLYESVAATFERLKAIFNLDLKPSVALLRRLQAGEVDLGGWRVPSGRWWTRTCWLTTTLGTRSMPCSPGSCPRSSANKVCDSAGGGWVYNWFCVDHVGYGDNPRRRDMGYHNIFDHYDALLREAGSTPDRIYFHYHPHGFRHEAHRCATHWWSASDSLFQVLSRRVIDRRWFPAAHRPGFHVIRPDSHWFLEQFIPFDYASQSMAPTAEDAAQFGLQGGRYGDWRRAPVTWEPYHPAADDYQVPGSCRRWVARCLNVGTRYRLLSDQDVRLAFEEARGGKAVILAVTNHDFRDMAPDVDLVRGLLQQKGRGVPGRAVRLRGRRRGHAARAAPCIS